MTTLPSRHKRTTRFSYIFLSLCLIGLWLIPTVSQAQLYPNQYRPPVKWHQIVTEQFRVVYPMGADSAAQRTAALLQSHYQEAQQLVGGSLRKFPVILNPENDLSNGFVSPFNFRMEVELAPIRGKALSPESGDWLNTVMPHELIHALHLNEDGGITSMIKLLAPDFARSFQSAAPGGILEGIAVEYETDYVRPHGGRGHYSYFTNPIYAIRSEDDPWSMGELLFRSSATLPYNRHYLGGYDFTDWLHDTYGKETTRKAIDFFGKWPFLGYGVALRHATGSWPGKLHDQYKKARLDVDQTYGKPQHETAATIIDAPFKGEQWYKPVWLSDTEFVAYGNFYNARAGFYRFNTESTDTHPELIYESRESEDHNHTLVSKDSNQSLLFSRYVPHTRWNQVNQSQLFQLDIDHKRVTPVSHSNRVYAPFVMGGQTYALQSWKNRNRLIKITNSIQNVIFEPSFKNRLIGISARSSEKKDNPLAVIANQNGQQALWITTISTIADDLDQPAELTIPKGSVFDPKWHPAENKLLLTIDHDSTMQVYEYEVDTRKLYRLTNGTLNAMEASYSPNGAKIAYVVQEGNERRLATVNYVDLERQPVTFEQRSTDLLADIAPTSKSASHSIFNIYREVQQRMDTTNWKTSVYRDNLSWLKPRIMIPGVEEEGNGYVYSANFYSTDLLQRHTYDLSLSYKYERFWHDFTYRYSGFYPGFDFSTNSDAILINDPNYYLMERRFELGVPFPLRFDSNNRSTSAYVRPFGALSQIRVLEKIGNENVSYFTNIPIAGIGAALNYRLQANPRDVQPNAGWQLFGEAQLDISINPPDKALKPDTPVYYSPPKRSGIQLGVSRYLSLPVMRRWNQSLKINARYLTQSKDPIYNVDPLISNAFETFPFAAIPNNLGVLNARYTIPLAHVDDGGLLIPAYLNSIYLVGFSSSAVDLDQSNWLTTAKSVLGTGIRARFQFGALYFDMGIALTWEPSRQQFDYFIGSF